MGIMALAALIGICRRPRAKMISQRGGGQDSSTPPRSQPAAGFINRRSLLRLPFEPMADRPRSRNFGPPRDLITNTMAITVTRPSPRRRSGGPTDDCGTRFDRGPDADRCVGPARPCAMEEFSSDILKGRVATPEDITGTTTFLASRDSDYMTGQIVMIDGGMTLV